jgi:lysozyme family protein
MRESFATALAVVLAAEGGYAEHPRDPGGPTFRGITLATLAAAWGRSATTAELRALTQAEIAAIYRRRFWAAVGGDGLPAGVDLAVFDMAVNSGPARAVRLLQSVLGVARDGVVGPRTLAAARGAPPGDLVRALCRARQGFLRRLAIWPVFGRGWTRRVRTVEARALALAAAAPPHSPTAHSKELIMNGLKPILLSRTVWSNLIGLAALAASAFGFDTGGIDTGGLADAALQVVAAGGFLASTVFRVIATKRLAG